MTDMCTSTMNVYPIHWQHPQHPHTHAAPRHAARPQLPLPLFPHLVVQGQQLVLRVAAPVGLEDVFERHVVP
jgi:hypothetical protein